MEYIRYIYYHLSSELQPVERLWPLINEAVANKNFQDLDELEQAQASRCLVIKSKFELIRSHTLFQLVAKNITNGY